MNHILVVLSREQDGQDATSLVGIINSQSVKIPENGAPCGYGAGKRVRIQPAVVWCLARLARLAIGQVRRVWP